MDAFGDTPISILPSVSKISSYYWQQMHFPCHVCRPTVQPCPTSSTRLEASNNVWKTLKETRLASARIAPTSPWRKKNNKKPPENQWNSEIFNPYSNKMSVKNQKLSFNHSMIVSLQKLPESLTLVQTPHPILIADPGTLLTGVRKQLAPKDHAWLLRILP